jgi:hypothetical protein
MHQQNKAQSTTHVKLKAFCCSKGEQQTSIASPRGELKVE